MTLKRERCLGIFEGQNISEFYSTTENKGEDFTPENGESIGDLRNRTRDIFKTIVKQIE